PYHTTRCLAYLSPASAVSARRRVDTSHSPTTLAFPLFFFNDTAPPEIYTLSLHDALPISMAMPFSTTFRLTTPISCGKFRRPPGDRKSTRLNSSHVSISYAVFCLKKKKYVRICLLR